MLPKQSIRQNISWLVTVNVLSKPIWFVFLLVSARLLGPLEFGKYMLSIGFMSVVIGVFEGGIDIHSIRTLAAFPDRFQEFFSYTIWLKIFSGVIAGMVAYGISIAVPSLLPDIGLFIAAAL